MCNIGGAYTSLGQHEGAIEHLTQALAIDRELGDQQGVGEDLNNLGTACLALGQYENAIEHLTQSLAISRTLGDQRGLGTDLGNLGNAHLQLGQYELAIKRYNQALEFDRVSGDRYGLGQRLGNLGNVYASLGQYERAIEHLTQALAISREIPDRRGEGARLGNLGNAYQQLGQYKDAIEHYTQGLAINREVVDQQGEGAGLGNLGNAYKSLGQYTDATEHYVQALAISRATGDQQGEGTYLNNLGLLYLYELNDPTAALSWLQQSRATFDRLWEELTTDERRVSFGEIFANVGRALQLAHAQLGQHTAALEEAERARSRAFELLLSQQRLAAKVGIAKAGAGATEMDASLTADAQPLRFDELLAVAEKQHVTIIVFSQITSSQLLAWVLRGGDTPLTMEQINIPPEDKSLAQLIELTRRTIGASARQGEAVVRSSGPERRLLVDRPSALAPPTVDETALKEGMSRISLVAEAKEGGTSRTDTEGSAAVNDLAALLSRCHELLIKPLSLVDGEPLLIIPDRDLYALPFAAMVDSEGKYLIERHSVRVAPSVGTVIELQRRAAARPPPSKPSAMVVGDPSFGGSDCSRDDVGSDSSVCWAQSLPGARKEARRIKSLLEDTDAYDGAVKKMVGDEAGKVAVVEAMRGCDVIHLATHGEPGAVLLGGATRAEGALSMAEVQRLELEARLVVLSECDSFRGKLTSDGVIGVSRAFVAAGALTLVASLWKVDDDATLALMSHFYKALLSSGGLGDAASALRSAMVAMIHDKNNKWSMLQWAGFVVYGLASAEAGKPLVTSSDSSIEHGIVASVAQTRSSEDEVEYAVTGPASVAPEATVFSLKVWAMIDAQVDRFAKTFQRLLEQGDKDHAHQLDDLDDTVSQLRVRVSVVGCTVEPSERTVQWNRKIVSSPHSVLIPANVSGNLSCTVIISDDSPVVMRDRDLFEQTFVIERGPAGVPQVLGVLAATVTRLEQQLQDAKAQLNSHDFALGLYDPVLVDKVKRASVRIGIYKTATKKLISLGSGTLIDAGPGAPVGQVLSAAHLFVRANNPTLPPYYVDPAIDWNSTTAPFLILVGMYQADDQPSRWDFWAELMTPLSVLQTTNPLPWKETLVDLAVLCIRGKIKMSPAVFTGPGLSETFDVVNRSNAATPLSLPDGIQLGEPLAVQTGISMVTVFGWFAPKEEYTLYAPQHEKVISNVNGLLVSQALLHTCGSGGAQVDSRGCLLAVNSRSSDPALPMPVDYKAYGRMISDLLPAHGLKT